VRRALVVPVVLALAACGPPEATRSPAAASAPEVATDPVADPPEGGPVGIQVRDARALEVLAVMRELAGAPTQELVRAPTIGPS
jgi:hypothetical protein